MPEHQYCGLPVTVSYWSSYHYLWNPWIWTDFACRGCGKRRGIFWVPLFRIPTVHSTCAANKTQFIRKIAYGEKYLDCVIDKSVKWSEVGEWMKTELNFSHTGGNICVKKIKENMKIKSTCNGSVDEGGCSLFRMCILNFFIPKNCALRKTNTRIVSD